MSNSYYIDLTGVENRTELHDRIEQGLPVPEWYGRNLDALYDCLTELPEPVHLVLKNWDAAADFAPGFESVFTDAQDFNPDFTVEYA